MISTLKFVIKICKILRFVYPYKDYDIFIIQTIVMNNKRNKKLLSLSALFIFFWATITLANNSSNFLNVRPVLNRAIQTIQKIAFNEDAIRHPEALDREVIVESNNGNVLIRWRVRALVDWTTGTLTPDSTGSSLFYGKNNYLAGTDSYIVAGKSNTISPEVSESAIIWGTNNKLNSWNNIYILWGSGNYISWYNDYIVGWENNKIDWENSYIIWWRDSEIRWANFSVAAWSDIFIDKDNVFAWKDTSDDVKLNPKKDNTFILFAQNWISIWHPIPKDVLPGTVDINWIFQVSTERKRCGVNIAGAIQYLPLVTWDIVWGEVYRWQLYWCFCTCDGREWVSMIPSKKCRDLCPTITWAIDADFQNGVCRYYKNQNAHIWWIDPSQACDNWEAADFVTEWQDSSQKYPKSWTWKCVGNVNTDENCWALAKIEKWECSTSANTWHADFFHKCKAWYYTWLTQIWWNSGLYSWSCASINTDNVNNTCTACKDNWSYDEAQKKCINKNWRCNNSFNWKNLADLKLDSIDSKNIWLCEYKEDGADVELTPTYNEDWTKNWWTWKCVGLQSVAKCSASYRVDPWRCARTTVEWISNLAKWCENGDFTGLKEKDAKNFVHWTCQWVNDPRSVECMWCPSWYQYNRVDKICDKTCCDNEKNEIVHDYETNTFIVKTCNTTLTLMDKNLWAENSNDVGYYYQWWNNHWFTAEEAKNNRTTTRAVWDNKYNRSWYDSSSFIIHAANENECLAYNYWAEEWKDGCTIHRDIWWWGIDWHVAWNYSSQYWSDTMLNVHSYAIQNFLDDMYSDPKKRRIKFNDYVLNTWALVRQWPCPEWYHVPAAAEWGALLAAYCEVYPAHCIDDTDKNRERSSLEKWILTRSTSNETLGDKFMNMFNLPKWWRIMAESSYPAQLQSKWSEWFYWSSSAWSHQYVHYLWFNKAQIYATRGNWETRRWAPIRCFKNPEIIDDSKTKCDEPHILTINYIWPDNKTLAIDKRELSVNEDYNVKSPSIQWMTFDTEYVKWKMPDRDLSIDVHYKNK